MPKCSIPFAIVHGGRQSRVNLIRVNEAGRLPAKMAFPEGEIG
jgi:hypothetical protein